MGHLLGDIPALLIVGVADSTLALMVTWTDIDFQLTLRKLTRPRRSVITSGTAR